MADIGHLLNGLNWLLGDKLFTSPAAFQEEKLAAFSSFQLRLPVKKTLHHSCDYFPMIFTDVLMLYVNGTVVMIS